MKNAQRHSHFADAFLSTCLILAVSDPLHAGEPAASRKMELQNIVLQDCGSCHGITLQGGLGASLRKEDLLDRGHTATTLQQVISEGRPAQAMPGWKAILTPSEILWISEALLDGRFESPAKGQKP